MDALDWGAKIFTWIQSSPPWLKLIFAAWIISSATIVIAAAFFNTNSPKPATRWPVTTDIAIDESHRRLNELDVNSALISDQTLIGALKPLFLRPLYSDIRNETTHAKLYCVCRTLMLLSTYVSSFKSAQIRNALISASGALSNIQGQMSSVYGPAFDPNDQCTRFGTNVGNYARAMPTEVGKLLDSQVAELNSYLRQLRDVLVPIGLIDFDTTIDNFKPTSKISADDAVLTPLGVFPSSPMDRRYGSDSNPAPEPANIYFANQTSMTLRVKWLTPDGLQTHYRDLQPYNDYMQPTYEGHLWLITDLRDKPLAMYRANRGYQKVTYPNVSSP
jgi:hypothetical protein